MASFRTNIRVMIGLIGQTKPSIICGNGFLSPTVVTRKSVQNKSAPLEFSSKALASRGDDGNRTHDQGFAVLYSFGA